MSIFNNFLWSDVKLIQHSYKLTCIQRTVTIKSFILLHVHVFEGYLKVYADNTV